jgi:hypothetical protein
MQQPNQQRRRRRRQCSHGVARIEDDVVKRQDPRPSLVTGRPGQQRLLERRCRAAIASHPVQHAGKREWRQHRHAIGDREGAVAQCTQERQGHQRSSAAECVAAESHGQCRDCSTGQPGGDHDAKRRRRQSDSREMNRENDGDQSDRGRANKRREEDQRRITTHAWPDHSSCTQTYSYSASSIGNSRARRSSSDNPSAANPSAIARDAWRAHGLQPPEAPLDYF